MRTKTVIVKQNVKDCPKCGKMFAYYPSRQKKGTYCSVACKGMGWDPRGENSPVWKGGRYVRSDGYILIKAPENHPYARGKSHTKYIREHRLIMEKKLGRYLLPWEVVHHINGIKDDNRPENLQLLENNSQHNTQIEKVYNENIQLKAEVEGLKIKLKKYEG